MAALARLPRTGEFAVTHEQRTAAEAHLVGLAAHHDAKALRILGRHVFEVIAPEVAERFEGQALEAEEAQALRRTTFTMWEDDEGTCHGRFRIPALHGQMLTKMILAITSPAHSTTAAGIDPDLPTPVRHGVAFTQLIESIPAEALPKTGGCSATIVVSMTLNQLLADLDAAGVCTLDTGGRISAAQARRLACTAGIIPLVLGGKSQVLDAGRKRRSHTEAMRIVMGVRDRGCTEEHCEAPPGLCHAHHDTPGPTADPPTSTPAGCCAPTTTAASTTPPTRPSDCPTARSASTDASESRAAISCELVARARLSDAAASRRSSAARIAACADGQSRRWSVLPPGHRHSVGAYAISGHCAPMLAIGPPTSPPHRGSQNRFLRQPHTDRAD